MNRFDHFLRLNCRFTEARMGAYLKGDLPPVQRRYVAHHIRHCACCSAEYARQRRLADALSRELPGFGRADRQQLALIWSDIQRELESPPSRMSGYTGHAAAAAGVVMLALSLVSGVQSMPLPALANTARTAAMSTATATPSPVHVVLLLNNTAAPSAVMLQNTPDSPSSER